MANISFQKAVKHEAKLRCALVGPAGSGKTYSALTLATGLGEKIAALDTEHGSMEKYADLFPFDVMKLDSFSPLVCIDGINAAAKAGYDVLVIDSLSHFWMGKDGELEMVDKAAKRSDSKNSFMAWKEVTPIHNQLIDAILSAPLHIIVTMRTKTEWVLEKNSQGKMEPRKIGLAPVMRDSIEFEFDVLGELDQDNTLIISKSRCPRLSGEIIRKPGLEVAETLKAWLTGAPAPELPKVQPTKAAPVIDRPLKVAPKLEPVLTEKQRGLVIKMQKESGVSDEDFKKYLTECFSITSRTTIPASAVDEVLAWLEAQHETQVPISTPAETPVEPDSDHYGDGR